jgi:hypothetical protein
LQIRFSAFRWKFLSFNPQGLRPEIPALQRQRQGDISMTPKKLNKAFALAGITMPTVRAHIERNMADVGQALQNATAKQLAAIVALHNTAYHQGRASCKAECLEGDANEGLYWLGGKDGVAVTMHKGMPSLQ